MDPGDVCCAKAVWQPGRVTADPYEKEYEEWAKELVTKLRGDSCFFYPLTDGLSLMAAEELEKRRADRREAERDRQHFREQAQKDRMQTRRLVWATFALVVVTFLLVLAGFWGSN